MSGIIRDFSLSSIEHLKGIINKNVEEDGELFLVDWVKDWFMDDLNIDDYINDIDAYHSNMIDKYDISTKKFDEILNKVHAVDISYANRFNSIYEGLSSFNTKIMNVTALIDPSAVTLDENVYAEFLSGVNTLYTKDFEKVKESIENDESQLDEALREVPWYESALNFVAGAGVELVKNNVEGLVFIPYAIVDDIFGTNLNEGLDNMLNNLEEKYILPNIGDKQAYYYGKVAGDVITIVEGAYGLASGASKIASGLAGMAGGTMLEATGVGAIFGAAAQAISIPLVLTGTAEMALASGICAEGVGNIGDNIMMASSSNNYDTNEKQSELKNKLDEIDTKDDLKIKEGYYDEHTIGPIKKFTERNGVSGGHNYDEFKNYFNNSDKYSLGEYEIIKSDIDGMYDIKYKVKVEKKNFKGEPTGEFKDIPPGERVYTKTVYDPAIISNEEIITLSKEAMKEGIAEGRVTPLKNQNKIKIFGETTYNDKTIKFEGLKNLDTGEVENAWPVLRWEE